jgi:TonB family protein
MHTGDRYWRIAMIKYAGSLLALALIPLIITRGSLQAAEGGTKAFAFVNPQYIITAEVASSHEFVLNFFNLSDFVIVAQPNEFIYKGVSGRFYIGQVFDKETKDTKGEAYRYSATFLLKGHSFAGLTVLGDFREMDQIEELSIRIGAKRFYMQSLEKTQFDQLAAKVENGLDLKSPNPEATLREANIQEIGVVKSTDGTSEWDRDWEGLIRTDGINEVKVIEHPEISNTDAARKASVSGKVRLHGVIDKNGVLQDVKVEKGLGHGLDERAVDGVKNSWVFLPATKNGEVIESSVTFEIPFLSTAKK